MTKDLSLTFKKTGAMHSAVRTVLKHHKLTVVGDGVVEADLIYAVLGCIQNQLELPSTRTLQAEVARLTDCLKTANSQAEEFERKWYLSCDEVETLQAERTAMVAASIKQVAHHVTLEKARDALQAKVTELASISQRSTKSAVVFGGRCQKHPLQIIPCKTCIAEGALKAQGICPDCEGAGEQGGQFCGGSWTCDSCHGTGKFSND